MSYRIGVDIGATTIKAGVVDETYRIILRSTRKTPDAFEDAMKAIADMIHEMADQLHLCISDFANIGFGAPCTVVPETGMLILANNTNWKDVSMKEEMSKYFSVPLSFANDANCAIIGETIAGAAKGRRHVLMLTLGTGVGSGIIINGKLFSGGDGLGAEMGHLTLVYDGIPCSCGLKGCLECYASATALIRQTKEAMKQHPESMMNQQAQQQGEVTGRTSFDCAKAGDAAALQVVDQYTSYLAGGLGSIINVLRPELIILGGGVSHAGDFLLDLIRKKLPQYIFAYDVVGGPEVKCAELGNDAGIIGAAYLDQM